MNALAVLARERFDIDLAWDTQSLAAFEHGLGPAVADAYDLVVYDHPFCGAVAAQGLMQPLETVLPGVRDDEFIGHSLASYRYEGHLWAVPVDGATQCAVSRPDLLDDALPRDWEQVLAFGQALRARGRWMGLATASPHGVLVLLALCANLGQPLADNPAATPFDRATLRAAADLLKFAAALVRPDGARMNAIDLHAAMVADDDLVYTPTVYAYLTYAEADQRRSLRFSGFPGPRGTVAGTVLGGTGLGITRSCRNVEAARRLVAMMADEAAQIDVIMCHHGQPGCASAWRGAKADARFDGAHAAIAETVRLAWMRPRFAGYVGWQAEAGSLVERFLASELSREGLIDALEAAWHRHGAGASG
jgi:multiple sugar transport system substrate-binding protein